MQIKTVHIELFLYIIFSNVYFNLVGTISIGEIWVLIVTPFILNRNILTQYPILKKITLIYSVYFIFQIISEYFTGNEINNALKGLANTIVSYCTMIYLFDRLKRNYYLIAIVFLFIAIRGLFFINTVGLGEDGVVFGMTSSSFFKFKVVPILTSLILFLSFFLLKGKKKNLVIVMLFGMSVFYAAFSARSAALSLFFVGIILLFGQTLMKNKRLMLPISIMILAFSYGSYVVWVENQLDDNLIIKNEQIDQMENPYSPIEMLKLGRTEFMAGALAFSDKLLFGHGAWAIDKTDQYHSYMLDIKDKSNGSYSSDNINLIPSHSIVLGAGVANGIFAFITVVWLMLYFLKMSLSIFPFLIKTPWAVIYLFQIISLIWTALFSPIPHLRIGIPLIFTCFIIFYLAHQDFIKFELLGRIQKDKLNINV